MGQPARHYNLGSRRRQTAEVKRPINVQRVIPAELIVVRRNTTAARECVGCSTTSSTHPFCHEASNGGFVPRADHTSTYASCVFSTPRKKQHRGG